MSGGRWPAEKRAEAIGLGVALGALEASKRTGIPRRTISKWLGEPDALVVKDQTRDQVAGKLWEAVQLGVAQVTAGLQDPGARLSDRARALEVVTRSHALLTGEATERTETIGAAGRDEDDAYAAMRGFLDQLDWDEAIDLRSQLDAAQALVLRDFVAQRVAAGHPALDTLRWINPHPEEAERIVEPIIAPLLIGDGGRPPKNVTPGDDPDAA